MCGTESTIRMPHHHAALPHRDAASKIKWAFLLSNKLSTSNKLNNKWNFISSNSTDSFNSYGNESVRRVADSMLGNVTPLGIESYSGRSKIHITGCECMATGKIILEKSYFSKQNKQRVRKLLWQSHSIYAKLTDSNCTISSWWCSLANATV